MAENKKGFVLYADQRSIIELLSNEKAGILFKHIFAYVNDENPKSRDGLINMAFEPIKLQLKRDLIKWVDIKGKRSTAGKISAEKRAQQNSTNSTLVDCVEQTSTNVNKSNSNSNSKSNSNNNTVPVGTIDFDKLLLFINKTFGRDFKIINDSVKNKFKARLKDGYTATHIGNCINNLKHDKFHIDHNYKYCTPDYISRSATLEMHSSASNIAKPNAPIGGYVGTHKLIDHD